MRDSTIINLYKNKGERNDCNSYIYISLLSIARVILMRLQKLAERIYPESQCGFRDERSSIDMVFSIRQLQEKCREQQMPMYIAFIDLTKAFDLVSRDGLFKVLPKIGCPPKLQSMIESFHTDTKGTAQFNGSSSKKFEIRSGVKQGCVLAPTLFGIFFCMLLKHTFDTTTQRIYLVPDQMAGSSTSHVSELRQIYARFSSGTCCLLMMQQLRPTPRRNSSH